MNAIDLLKQDHRTVEKLFTEYNSAEEDLDRREELFQGLERELLTHGDAEEQIFYPALKNDAPELVEQSLSDHQQVKQLLSEMLEYEVDDQEFEWRINKLMERVQAHVQQEEGPGGVLELASQRLDQEELDSIGRRI